ncbi:hypothetical protein ACVWYH_001980 [Bradyrhizobium sp. GM24.11]
MRQIVPPKIYSSRNLARKVPPQMTAPGSEYNAQSDLTKGNVNARRAQKHRVRHWNNLAEGGPPLRNIFSYRKIDRLYCKNKGASMARNSC